MDWLASHEEPGQTYQQYVESRPNLPFAERKKLYILPLGSFDPELAPALEDLQKFTAAYFHPLEVKMAPAAAGWETKVRSRVNRGTQKQQLNSLDVIKWMRSQLPGDAYAMLAVTMTDLYPEESWNFVFGQASIRNRVGVFSFARYHPGWTGREAVDSTKALVLSRSAKVLTHEMGHMFGIRHCVHFECNMNGANHLAEADATPMHLCPVCLRKLHHAARFDPVKRYGLLGDFYQKHGLNPESDWVSKRITAIKGVGD
jgi:archaemetzincin